MRRAFVQVGDGRSRGVGSYVRVAAGADLAGFRAIVVGDEDGWMKWIPHVCQHRLGSDGEGEERYQD
jgi:hypothetical protein